MSGFSLNHLTEKSVDLVLTVAKVTTLNKVGSLLAPAAGRGVQLEGPEEVVGLLELGTNGDNLVDEVLNASEADLAESSLNDGVVTQRNSLAVDLSVASLVDKLSDQTLRRIAVGNVGLNSSDHVPGSLVESNEHSVVELSQSQELEDLFAGGV